MTITRGNGTPVSDCVFVSRYPQFALGHRGEERDSGGQGIGANFALVSSPANPVPSCGPTAKAKGVPNNRPIPGTGFAHPFAPLANPAPTSGPFPGTAFAPQLANPAPSSRPKLACPLQAAEQTPRQLVAGFRHSLCFAPCEPCAKLPTILVPNSAQPLPRTDGTAFAWSLACPSPPSPANQQESPEFFP